MTRTITRLTGSVIVAAALAVPAMAQTSPAPGATMPATTTPAVTTPNVPVDNLAMTGGIRASKIIGSSVTNEAKETVGTVGDLIITPDEKVPVAVLSVGGFLGMGTKYVAVPFTDLKVTDGAVMMPGATKASLKTLPAFTYKG
ncbi:MAG: hypothetical protein ABS99_01775 [Acetobacteraceae bacterium SCN 69-10]|nr:PRC-barrel domain-containing protein [Rhodospirillales bacterium]ODU62005.1 MAG: hypothetical protein ABS99_01775 [Acetobacteraceae bacterium SCN 69-10]OJY77022.1 MAG: hypothetical protein BGP12_06220 [Rhodospirillales bacterium 70-18]